MERRSPSAARTPLNPDELSRRSFSTAFRGFDQTEVRDFLNRISDDLRAAKKHEEELETRIGELEYQLSQPPVIDDAMITSHLGEETAKILQSAHEAAAEIRQRADQELNEIMGRVDSIRKQLREEADAYAAEVRTAADADAEAMLSAARERAHELMGEARGSGRSVLEQAQQLRNRVLQDLAKRRRVAYAQVEQLLAGRDHLLEAVQLVRANLDEMTAALQQAESEARTAAEAARDRTLEETDDAVAELESALAPVESPAALEEEITPEFVEEDEVDELGEERTSNALRIVRRKRRQPESTDQSLPSIPLETVEFGDENEGIKILRPDEEPETEDAEIIDLRAYEAEIAQDDADVDSLFAQMRADRERAVAEAERILAEQEQEPKDIIIEEVVDISFANEAIAARDEFVEPLAKKIAKQLKRIMQNEQNEVLDAIRNQKGRPSVDSLPNEEHQRETYLKPLREGIIEAVHGGMSFASSGVSADIARQVGADIEDFFFAEFLAPLRRRLQQAVVATQETAEDHERAVLDAVGTVYRETKNQRVEPIARDILNAAYASGISSSVDADAKLAWVLAADTEPCEDCRSNAAAGPMPAGVSFATGHQVPPVHPGCGCLVIPV